MNKIQCPYCGKERQVPSSTVTRSDSAFKREAPNFTPESGLNIANKGIFGRNSNTSTGWIDITCSNCHNTYQYNTVTQIVRP